jgi:hypothetical protein
MYDRKQGALLISISLNFCPERPQKHHGIKWFLVAWMYCGIHQRNQLKLRTQDIHVNCEVNLIQSYTNSRKSNKSFEQFCNPNSFSFCSRSLMIVLVCQTFFMIWCMEIWDDWYCYLLLLLLLLLFLFASGCSELFEKCGYKKSVQHGTCLHSLSTCDLKFLGAKCTLRS